MLNKSHPLGRYMANCGRNKKQRFDALHPDARVFVLSN